MAPRTLVYRNGKYYTVQGVEVQPQENELFLSDKDQKVRQIRGGSHYVVQNQIPTGAGRETDRNH